MKMRKAKCVYAILNPENKRIKLGIAEDVAVRLNSLESGAGCKLELICCTYPIIYAEEAERNCHKRFREKQYYGEWFVITKEEARDCIKSIQARYALDEMVYSYLKEGMAVVDIAKKFNVTTQAVVEKLKRFNIYGVYCPEEPREAAQIETEEEVDITEYTRIDNNKYEHKLSKEVRNIKWVNSRFMACNQP